MRSYRHAAWHLEHSRRGGRALQIVGALALLAVVVVLTVAAFFEIRPGIAPVVTGAIGGRSLPSTITYQAPMVNGGLVGIDLAMANARRFVGQETLTLGGGLEVLPTSGSSIYYLETLDGQETFKIDARTGEVIEAAWLGNLKPGQPGEDLTLAQAESLARSFAQAHFFEFNHLKLVERSMSPAANGALYTLKWALTDPASGAELPTSVAVSVSSESSRVAWYLAQREPLTIDARPVISREQAIAAAAGQADRTGSWDSSRVESVRLQVVFNGDGQQQLVWTVLFPNRPDSGQSGRPYLRVSIDATTGAVTPI